jgi:hypothetical protein
MESLVMLAITGTKCIKNRQTNRQTFFFMYIEIDRQMLPWILHTYMQCKKVIVQHGLGEISPKPPPPLPEWRRPPLDLPLYLEKCHGKFGDTSYYRGQMHKEQTDRQTNKQTFFFVYIDWDMKLRPTQKSISVQANFIYLIL